MPRPRTGLLLTIALAIWAGLLGSSAFAGKRMALVIGNSAYGHSTRLQNPANDARDVASALRELAFEVDLALDLPKKDFETRLQGFANRASGADVALLFFAGHGIGLAQETYLLPTDADFETAFEARNRTIALSEALGLLRGSASTVLAFIDACRDNPFAEKLARTARASGRSAEVSRGLVRIEVSGGETLVVYSTTPGRTAADGDGANSPFTKAFLAHVATPGVEVETMLKRVSQDVKTATGSKQEPERLSRLSTEFYFKPAAPQATLPQKESDREASARADFDRVKGIGTAEAWDLFLAQHPDGFYAALARAERTRVAAPLPPSTPDRPPDTARTQTVATLRSDCERLASPPNLDGQAGVDFDAMDGPAAVKACGGAFLAQFDDPKVAFLLGRAKSRILDYSEAKRLYELAALRQYTPAINNLGAMYKDGRGVGRDDAKAVELFQRAAKVGDRAGLNNLGTMYEAGRGVPRDHAEAVRLYREAASKGDGFGMTNLGFMLKEGRGVPRNDEEAVRLFRLGIEKGIVTALSYLGQMYREGRGVPADDVAAVDLFRLAANRGSAFGQMNLAYMYEHGRGVPKDYGEAIRLFRESAAKGNDAALNSLGWMHENGLGVAKNAQMAVGYYRQAADAGNTLAMLNLSRAHAAGRGVPKSDAESVRYLRQAADLGNREAMNNLGLAHENGRGLARSDSEAVRLYRLSAGQGHPPAQFNLGRAYRDGRGVPQDLAEAVRNFRLAADQGYVPAIREMAKAYADGKGVDKDPVEAKRWNDQAAARQP